MTISWLAHLRFAVTDQKKQKDSTRPFPASSVITQLYGQYQLQPYRLKGSEGHNQPCKWLLLVVIRSTDLRKHGPTLPLTFKLIIGQQPYDGCCNYDGSRGESRVT